MRNSELELELMAAALFRYLNPGRVFTMDATPFQQANYIAFCRESAERLQAEQAQQPHGQKEVA